MFKRKEDFEACVVDKLNEISCLNHQEDNVYFSHNGFINKFCTLKCSWCGNLVTFEYEGTAEKPYNIKYRRFLYGSGIHFHAKKPKNQARKRDVKSQRKLK